MGLAGRLFIDRRPPMNTLSVLALPLSLGVGMGLLAPSSAFFSPFSLSDGVSLRVVVAFVVLALVGYLARLEVRPLLVLLYFSIGLVLGKTSADDSLVQASVDGVFSVLLVDSPSRSGPHRAVLLAAWPTGPHAIPPKPRWRGRYPLRIDGLRFAPDPTPGPRAGQHWMLAGRLHVSGSLLPRAMLYANTTAASWTPGGLSQTDLRSRLRSRWEGLNGWFSSIAGEQLGRVRRSARRTIGMGASPRSAGLLRALVLGERVEVSPSLRESFARTGTSHLLAISGLHVGLLYFLGNKLTLLVLGALFWQLCPRLAELGAVRALTMLFGLSFAATYVLLAGSPMSGQRALGMLVAAVFAGLARRRAAGAGLLGVAVIAVLVTKPWAVGDLGLALSVISVSTILVAPRSRMSATKGWTKRLCGGVARGLLIAGLVSLTTAPLVAHVFGRVPVFGWWVGPLAILLLGGGATSLVLAGVALGNLSPGLGAPVVAGASFFADAGIDLVTWAGAPSRSPMFLWAPDVQEVALAYVGLVVSGWTLRVFGGCLTRFRAAPDKRLRIPVLQAPRSAARATLAVLLLVVLFGCQSNPRDELCLRALDVGQGEALLVELPGERWLVDGGGRAGAEGEVGVRRVLPTLRRLGVERLDRVFISHPDADHYEGLFALPGAVEVGEVWVGGRAGGARFRRLLQRFEKAGSTLVSLDDGPSVLSAPGAVQARLLHPSEEWRRTSEGRKSKNEDSLVLSISLGKVGFLLTGDIEEAAEAWLVRTGRVGPHAVLKLAHHGSKSSSTEGFVNKVSPLVALASVGRDNRFGFPHASVRRRLLTRGVNLHWTGGDGDIEVCTDGSSLRSERVRGNRSAGVLSERSAQQVREWGMSLESALPSSGGTSPTFRSADLQGPSGLSGSGPKRMPRRNDWKAPRERDRRPVGTEKRRHQAGEREARKSPEPFFDERSWGKKRRARNNFRAGW